MSDENITDLFNEAEQQARETLFKAVKDKYGQALADLVVLLYPALKNLALSEINVLIEKLTARKTDEAIQMLYAKMSDEEVVQAKQQMVPLLQKLADQNCEFHQMLHNLFIKGLEIGLGFVLTGVLL